MSRKGERTRETILDAALALFREHGPGRVSVGDVAERAGLTRQAVYLHFPNRTVMMLALIDHVGRQFGAPELFRCATSGSARDELDERLRAAARYAPRIHDVATALDLARHSDDSARAAWDDRMELRRRGLRGIVRRLKAAGALREGWSVARVTDALWTVTAPRTYADLVVERRWPLEDYERFLVSTARAFLVPARR